MSGNDKKLSRRDFLKNAGVIAGGASVGAAMLLSGCNQQTAATNQEPPKPDWLPEKWDHEADVVVVGCGGAGGAAAIEAYDNGASVIILEKNAQPGGSTTLCAGIYYAAGTSLQKDAGIEDNPDEMYKYYLHMGGGLADPDNVRVLCDNAAKNLEWLISLGATNFKEVNYSGGERDPENANITPPKPRGHYINPAEPTYDYPPPHPAYTKDSPLQPGTGYFKPLWEGIKARNIPVLMETRAVELIINPITKEVLGVKAESKGATVYVKGKKAVILTTGGYGQNKEKAKYFCREVLYAENYTKSDTGDGIIMGLAAGAGVANMDQSLTGLTVFPGAICVNQFGRRFVDETLYRVPGEMFFRQKGIKAWNIFDNKLKGNSTQETIEAPTIRELAEKIGVNPDVLEDTVKFWNESVKLGIDREFGRTQRAGHLREPFVPMDPIETPPFHAIERNFEQTVTAQGITMGGLRINTKSQVLFNVSNQPIPRLYAAGRTTNGSFGEMYPGSGSAVADAICFGRIAGKNAAAETPWS